MSYKTSLLLLICFACACSGEKIKTKQRVTDIQETVKNMPVFNADSAYTYTKKQVDFGPRVPGTAAHKACGNYLATELKRFGATVVEQEAGVKLYNGNAIHIKNLIGSFQPENKNRILLCAHWDTRPFADHDPNSDNHKTPIDGANDGAGSCAVLLEIARQIQTKQPQAGVDIIFFDAEDWGVPAFDRNRNEESGYCLGSEYWAKNPHIKDYTAKFGILLDMVGAHDAVFYKEYYSLKQAANIVRKVWETAAGLGYNRYFINAAGGSIEDDHLQIIRYRQIPCIDIIHYDPQSPNGFGSYWHTLNDNMDNISKDTFKAVGETILHVIYNES
jgi:Zn-dependent M28 family amino/carboxypeptidase